ncbi:MAG: N-acetylmuramoyl-L-alanine amidase [Bacteroidota bacterium]|nr:N-acetylmuramoyl-L-alanine amidase [Bacteroidota bacterium]
MKIFILSLFLFFCSIINGQTVKNDSNVKPHSIFLAIPESDTAYTSGQNYALSASTTPGSKVTVNDKEFKTYSSGAFAGLLQINEGENHFLINSVSPKGEIAKKEFIIIKRPWSKTISKDSLAIDEKVMEPKMDLWLGEGDILSVRVKATPGCKVTFLDNQEMTEIPVSEINWARGIYEGTYKVTSKDKKDDIPLTFTLVTKDGRSITKQTERRISFKGDEFPMVGRTKGDRPYLNIGLGDDRLGGAKLGFLTPGIKLKIIGKAGSQYKVNLSGNLNAWIPEDQVELLPKGTFLPYSLTSSWNVYGDKNYDYVSVGLNEKLPFTSYQDPENNRIIVDLHGAVSNTNWIVQDLTTKEIKNVYYEVPEEGLFRIIIELKHKQSWGYKTYYTGTDFVIRIKPQPKDLDFDKMTFVLDAGHGGSNLGALGATGAREKDINLSMVYQIKKILEDKGAKVILTRKDDTYSTNSERLKAIEDSNADMLISIHSNSIGYSSNPENVKGLSTFYKYICYRPLSTFIYNEAQKAGIDGHGNVGSFNFTLNSPTELPNVLVELGYMSNPEDEIKLLDDDFREELAKRIVKGIGKYFDYCEE